MLLVWMLMYQRLLTEDVPKFNVTKVDVGKYFITKLMFVLRDHRLQLIYVKVAKLGFMISIERYNSDFDRRKAYIMMC